MLIAPLCIRDRSGVLEECSQISSVTPGEIYPIPKFQVIMLLDIQHEKQDFFPTLIQGSSGGKHLKAMRWVPAEAQLARLHRCWGLLLEVSQVTATHSRGSVWLSFASVKINHAYDLLCFCEILPTVIRVE